VNLVKRVKCEICGKMLLGGHHLKVHQTRVHKK